MAPSTPSSSRISTAIARNLVACSRPWWAQKSRSAPPGRIARTAARAPQRSQRSAGETGGAAVVVVITSYPTPVRPVRFRTSPGVSPNTRPRENEPMSSQTVAPSRAENAPARADIPGRTLRGDRWWLQPLIIFLGFSAFIVYATYGAFDHHFVQSTHTRIFYADPYLSPFYSPCFSYGCPSDVA